MHETRARELSDVIREAKVWAKITPKLRTGEVGVNVWVEAEYISKQSNIRGPRTKVLAYKPALMGLKQLMHLAAE